MTHGIGTLGHIHHGDTQDGTTLGIMDIPAGMTHGTTEAIMADGMADGTTLGIGADIIADTTTLGITIITTTTTHIHLYTEAFTTEARTTCTLQDIAQDPTGYSQAAHLSEVA